ncbi:MAG TPA: M12 family metallo-peptidase [Longimicrobium sp.]|nr:M12 family metallo-peptidase [Longimicrobium sp.]
MIAELFLLLCAAPSISAQNGTATPNPWEPVAKEAVTAGDQRSSMALRVASARTDRLDLSLLQSLLAPAPPDTGNLREGDGAEVYLPVPGRLLPRRYERFRVRESSLVPRELASHLGGLRTYSGRGIDNPSLTTRFSVSDAGLTGIVIGPEGTWIIDRVTDPAGRTAVVNARPVHVSAYKEEIQSDHQHRIRIDTPPSPSRGADRPPATPGPLAPRAAAPVAQLPEDRVFRLAVAATRDYVDFFRNRASQPISDDAARDSALKAIVETINLVQALYERELGIRFELTPRERELIFAADDGGYPHYQVDSVLLARNQAVLDSILGPGSYDLGHVFTQSDGGLAWIASLCQDSIKAQGGTGLDNPLAEKYFAIDYVAHEIGHQFDGHHTFNATDAGSCTPDTRDPEYAFEPGSGSTVMGYAGICHDQSHNRDVDRQSGEYFHVSSLENIAANVGRLSCGRREGSGNSRPVVTTATEWTIPKETPYVLTAHGTDPDGDPLTYTWEEYYPGNGWNPEPSPPDEAEEGFIRPSFRSFPPSREPSRTFPRLEALLFGESAAYERLSTINRNPAADRPLNFRVTARDGRGAFASADVAVNVVAWANGDDMGPFTVTRPIAGLQARRGEPLEVRWTVANTDRAPVQCASVRILLATDRSGVFADTLAASTPNDGSEKVLVPTGPATRDAWVRVECVGNIFFNVSKRFRLLPPPKP